MLSLRPGQTEQIITVMVNAAPEYDLAKTFDVNLSDPMGVTISTGQATGTIRTQRSTPGRDRQRDGDRQYRRPDRRELQRHPFGTIRVAGDDRLCHR